MWMILTVLVAPSESDGQGRQEQESTMTDRNHQPMQTFNQHPGQTFNQNQVPPYTNPTQQPGNQHPRPPITSPTQQPGYGYDQNPQFAGTNHVQCTTVVASPSAVNPAVEDPRRPGNYLVAAILCTLFVFMPTGIAAIVLAVYSQSLADDGKFNDARRFGKYALYCILASVIVWCTAFVLIILLYAFVFRFYEYV